ncbi:TetR/AcrR family transcriptional regulator [Phycicoccus elongatus]|uniref:TetR/AcrR family transcriptional regulator n=1 Tax=Phycicoccus elongatus TaxID=101689 RepID=UPI0037843952
MSSPAGSRQERAEARVEARRRQILDAATRIMIRTGYHEMSMQAVAEDAGMSVGLIYQYFGGKQEILRAVIVDILDAFRAEVPAAMSAAGEDPQAQLAAGFAAFCAVIDEKRAGALLAYRESPTLDAAGQAEIIRLEQETIDPFRVAVEAGIASGVFRPVPADLVAHNLKLAAHGWALKHWDVGARLDLAAYVEAELDLHLAAIRA